MQARRLSRAVQLKGSKEGWEIEIAILLSIVDSERTSAIMQWNPHKSLARALSTDSLLLCSLIMNNRM